MSKNTYDLQLKLSQNNLIIKVVDSEYTIYKTSITKQHQFVQQFLKENLPKLKGFLEVSENIEIIEELNAMKVCLKEPVYIEFILQKQHHEGLQDDIRKEIINKFNQLMGLEKKLTETNMRISNIEKQLSYGVILPGYKSVLPINLETLYINYVPVLFNNKAPEVLDNIGFKSREVHNNYHSHHLPVDINRCVDLGHRINPYCFDGHTLEPVAYLKNLKRIYLRHIEDSVQDISPLYQCRKLEVIRIHGFPDLKSVDFSNWPKLKLVVLYDLPNIEEIRTLEKIDIEELCIVKCPKLLKMPDLASKVNIEK